MSVAATAENLSAEPRSQLSPKRLVEMSRMPSGVSVSLLKRLSESVERLRSSATSLKVTRESFGSANSSGSSESLNRALGKLRALSEP